ncbi:MAG: 50S ribosomal protein L23 [Candidatus Margulisbacteria bacterium]|nr:50S ribosomal protein L23 [Candidatus Margulisiibacteriota bacterium]
MEFEHVLIAPLLTEKSVTERARSRYTFKVNAKATKIQVKQAVEKAFKVKVVDVNTCIVRAKRRILGRSIGKTSGWKKAYITLAAGQKIQELEA